MLRQVHGKVACNERCAGAFHDAQPIECYGIYMALYRVKGVSLVYLYYTNRTRVTPVRKRRRTISKLHLKAVVQFS